MVLGELAAACCLSARKLGTDKCQQLYCFFFFLNCKTVEPQKYKLLVTKCTGSLSDFQEMRGFQVVTSMSPSHSPWVAHLPKHFHVFISQTVRSLRERQPLFVYCTTPSTFSSELKCLSTLQVVSIQYDLRGCQEH